MWETFAKHHGFERENPTDEQIVAFVHARALVGHSWSGLNLTLDTLRLGLTSPDVITPAIRHLTDLHDDAWFDVAYQAPLLTVGEVAAMIERATSARDKFLVAMTYLAGLRPDEWVEINREHIEVSRYGRVVMLLPQTKTGAWQKVRITPLPGSVFDLAAITTAYLNERGTSPGPLVTNHHGNRLVSPGIVLKRAAAAAGVRTFSTYSLRRSMAVHANLLGVHGAEIRKRLRHSPNSQTWRRYIEPLLALLNRDDLTSRYLATGKPAAWPIDVRDVSSGRPSIAPANGFATGSLSELLSDVDLPGTRVPVGLTRLSRESIENGNRMRRRFLAWARENGHAGSSPAPQALLFWLNSLVNGGLEPVTVYSYVCAVRIGWLSTARHEPPGFKQAHQWALGAVQEARRTAKPSAKQYKSRPAQVGEVFAVCQSAWELVPEHPPQQWATLVLTRATGATTSVEVVNVTSDQATILVDGATRQTVRRGEAGVFCPVAAADAAKDAGSRAVNIATVGESRPS